MSVSHRLWTRVFLLGGLILFSVGLFFISDRQNLFHRTFEVYTEFDQVNGLQRGAKVHVSGMEGGEVIGTEIPKQSNGKFRLRLRIQQDLHPLVLVNSVATIKTMGLAGNSFIDIQKGKSHSAEVAEGGTLPSKEPFDIADLEEQGGRLISTTQATISGLRGQAESALQSLNAAARNTDQAITAMRPGLLASVLSARKTSQSLSEIVAQVQHGQGALGELVMDEKLAGSLNQTVENARQSSINLQGATARANEAMADLERRDLVGRAQQVLDNTRQITQQLNQAIAGFTSSPPGDETAALHLRDTLASAQTAMRNLADDSEAAKHNFLLRGFFKRRGYFDLHHMTPARYRSSRFVKAASSERVWLPANDLFSSGPDGREALTAAGKQQIDSAMSGLVSYLPNSPLVVEGYSMQGAPSEQYLQAKRRATLVQTYLEQRFGLQASLVAAMPLSSSVPPGLGKSTWDGISLVTIRER